MWKSCNIACVDQVCIIGYLSSYFELLLRRRPPLGQTRVPNLCAHLRRTRQSRCCPRGIQLGIEPASVNIQSLRRSRPEGAWKAKSLAMIILFLFYAQAQGPVPDAKVHTRKFIITFGVPWQQQHSTWPAARDKILYKVTRSHDRLGCICTVL